MTAKIIDGREIAGKLHRKTAEKVEQLKLVMIKHQRFT